MVGRELTQLFPKENIPTDEVVLEIKGFADSKFKNVSFKLHKGEILGLAGLIGAGRTEVIESLFGLRPRDAGEIYIKGQKVEINSPVDAINCGIGLLTEDRKLSGLFLPLSVEDNITVVNIDAYIKTGLLSHKRMSEDCERMVKLLNIKTPSLSQIVSNLSGGNQQKVIIARWLLPDSDILIMDEPTRGIDVGAKAEIHKLMSDLAKQGKAIIMISSELPEILGMSDRIVVMHEGVVTGELTRDEATQENVMKLATGSK
jgi:inositol transport system ATP-binding protein